MNRLFEDYVAGYLNHHLKDNSGLRLGAQVPEKLNHPGASGDLNVRADLVIYRNEIPVALMDTKYRDIGEGGVKDAEAYQVVAYAHAFRVDKVALIYPSSTERERFFHVKGTDVELRTFSIDLRGGPASIEAESRDFCRDVEKWVDGHPTTNWA